MKPWHKAMAALTIGICSLLSSQASYGEDGKTPVGKTVQVPAEPQSKGENAAPAAAAPAPLVKPNTPNTPNTPKTTEPAHKEEQPHPAGGTEFPPKTEPSPGSAPVTPKEPPPIKEPALDNPPLPQFSLPPIDMPAISPTFSDELLRMSMYSEELQQMTFYQEEMQKISAQLLELEAEIHKTEEDLAAAEEKFQSRLDTLEVRLKEIYVLGDINYFEVMLQAKTIDDLLTRFVLMQQLVEEDSQLLRQIETEHNLITSKKGELEAKRAEMENILKELEAASERLKGMIGKLQRVDTMLQPGFMLPPTPGYHTITSPFGMRMHPVLQREKLHTGVDFSAPMGAGVVAAKGGTVIIAGPQGGYGNAVVIDHGGGVTTVYAHLSAFAVRAGDPVIQGQPIGLVGSTGLSTGPHAHFEVRINGTPVDPMPYLATLQ